MEKIVVYTAIFGGYNELIEQPQFENVDYVCFTDRNLSSSSWKVVVIPEPTIPETADTSKSYPIFICKIINIAFLLMVILSSKKIHSY